MLNVYLVIQQEDNYRIAQFVHCGRIKVNMGNIYYKQKKFSLAIKMYQAALDETSSAYKETRYRILCNIGNAFMRLGQYQVSFGIEIYWSLFS